MREPVAGAALTPCRRPILVRSVGGTARPTRGCAPEAGNAIRDRVDAQSRCDGAGDDALEPFDGHSALGSTFIDAGHDLHMVRNNADYVVSFVSAASRGGSTGPTRTRAHGPAELSPSTPPRKADAIGPRARRDRAGASTRPCPRPPDEPGDTRWHASCRGCRPAQPRRAARWRVQSRGCSPCSVACASMSESRLAKSPADAGRLGLLPHSQTSWNICSRPQSRIASRSRRTAELAGPSGAGRSPLHGRRARRSATSRRTNALPFPRPCLRSRRPEPPHPGRDRTEGCDHPVPRRGRSGRARHGAEPRWQRTSAPAARIRTRPPA